MRNSGELFLGKNILVVENEWLIAGDFCRVLVSEGARVMGPAASVNEAFALIEKALRIDAAVLDIHLGSCSDIYPVADTLRSLGMPFVFTTGLDKHKIRPDFISVTHLRKPFSPSAIGPALVAATSRAGRSSPACW